MLDAIPPQLLTGAGWGTLVILVVWLIFTDRLIPRSSHMREVAAKDTVITYLSTALETRDQEAALRTEQMQKLLVNSDLTVQMLTSIAREAHRGDLPA